jgi:hypothetical protein
MQVWGVEVSNLTARLRREGEIPVRDYFRGLGFPSELIPDSGKDDEGDVSVDAGGDVVFVIEVKNVQKFDLAGFVAEAKVEADNYAKARGRNPDETWPVVIMKRRGTRDVAKWYAVTEVGDFPW